MSYTEFDWNDSQKRRPLATQGSYNIIKVVTREDNFQNGSK